MWVATESDINTAVQPLGTAIEDGLKLEISNIVLWIGCMILLWHFLGLPYNYGIRKKWDCKFMCLFSVNKDADQIHST